MERTVLVHRRGSHSEEDLKIEVLAVSRILLDINGDRVECPKGKGVWGTHQVTAELQGAHVKVTITPTNEVLTFPVVKPKIGKTQDEVTKQFGKLLAHSMR